MSPNNQEYRGKLVRSTALLGNLCRFVGDVYDGFTAEGMHIGNTMLVKTSIGQKQCCSIDNTMQCDTHTVLPVKTSGWLRATALMEGTEPRSAEDNTAITTYRIGGYSITSGIPIRNRCHHFLYPW